MCKLTIEDYRKAPISDIFLVTIIEDVSESDGKEVLEKMSDEEKEIAGICKAENMLEEIASKVYSELGESKKEGNKLLEFFKSIIPCCLEISLTIAVLKHEGKYFNLSPLGELIIEEKELKFMRPFSDYVKEGEYKFIEKDGRVVLDIEPFDSIKRYEDEVKQLRNLK